MNLQRTENNPVRIANGDIGRVRSILDELKAESVLLVTHSAAYHNSGADTVLEPALSGRRVCRFTDFEPNPSIQDAERAVELQKAQSCNVALAVGGGSAIDMTKLVCAFVAQETSPREVMVQLPHLKAKKFPMIAVPTTAGTGSEATHFAVVYLDGQKYSIAHPSLLPDFAIVDPELTHGMPRDLTAVTGLDALCQAVESLWAVQSTEESRRFAEEAVRLAWGNLESAVRRPTPASRFAMCQASHLAGRAINISKTTASHAISYSITSRCGVPHGHAVALTLGPILMFNSEVGSADIADPRGMDYVRETIKDILEILDCRTPQIASQRISQLMEAIGCPTRLSELGVNDSDLLHHIATNVNVERLENNPRAIGREQLKQILVGIA